MGQNPILLCHQTERPSGPEIAKKLKKGLFGVLEKSLGKYPKKSKNIVFRTFLGIFSVFLDFFGYFPRLFSRPPKRPFLRLFCDFGPGGPGDSCKWRLGSQKQPVYPKDDLGLPQGRSRFVPDTPPKCLCFFFFLVLSCPTVSKEAQRGLEKGGGTDACYEAWDDYTIIRKEFFCVSDLRQLEI